MEDSKENCPLDLSCIERYRNIPSEFLLKPLSKVFNDGAKVSASQFDHEVLTALCSDPWGHGDSLEVSDFKIHRGPILGFSEDEYILNQEWAKDFKIECENHAVLRQFRFLRTRVKDRTGRTIWLWVKSGSNLVGVRRFWAPEVQKVEGTQLAKDWESFTRLMRPGDEHVAIVWAFRIAEVILKKTLSLEGIPVAREFYKTLYHKKISHIFSEADLRFINKLKRRRDRICHKEVDAASDQFISSEIQQEFEAVAGVNNVFISRYSYRVGQWGELGSNGYE